MTAPTKKEDPFDAFLDSYLAELMAMPDEDVLGGDDADPLKAVGLKMVDEAKAEGGRRRLARAKVRLSGREKAPQDAATQVVSADEARAYLRRAANDPRYTLAARGLDEMSDDDAIRLYGQIKRLERGGDGSTEDEA